MKLYQYVVMWHPGKEEKDAGRVSEIVIPVTTILAHDEKQATIVAAREIPEFYEKNLEQVEIAVRPF